MAPYKNFLNWRKGDKSQEDTNEDGSPRAGTSGPVSGRTGSNVSGTSSSSFSPSGFGPSGPAPTGSSTFPNENTGNVSPMLDMPLPSNISIASSRPSTYQSSLFSRPRTMASGSTAPTSRHSNISYSGFPAIAEDRISLQSGRSGMSSLSTSAGKPMKVVELKEFQSVEEDQTQTSSSSTYLRTNSRRSQSQRPNVSFPGHAGLVGSMPEVPAAELLPSLSHTLSNSPSHRFSVGSGSANSVPISSLASTPVPSAPIGSPSDTVTSSAHAPSSTSSGRNTGLSAFQELKKLAEDLSVILDQANSKVIELGRAAVLITQMLHNSAQSPAFESIDHQNEHEKDHDILSIQTEPSLSRIIKISLHFSDNLLRTNQLTPSRSYLLKALYELGVRLKLVEPVLGTVPYPSNFAVGSLDPPLPSLQRLVDILDLVSHHDSAQVSDQEGAFIAPILRGLSPQFAVLTLSFGLPHPEPDHYSSIAGLCDLGQDIHIYCQKNSIKTCAGAAGGFFRAPYRLPTNPKEPPISLSIAAENASTISGTLGGYLYPKIDPENPEMAAYARSTFAVTCAHVCLTETGGGYPFMSVPSPVLVNMYRKALVTERNKYPVNSEQNQLYRSAIEDINTRHLPKSQEPFGQVVWGERTVSNGAISDIAIIKCSAGQKCRNYLGDDVAFSEYDPGLMFGNLHVKRIVRKMTGGMSVFKYGSTTKYTKGKINGPRLVYWADGKIQSSEFVVSSDSPAFACGGDSGAWILHKEEPLASGDGEDLSSEDDSVSTDGVQTLEDDNRTVLGPGSPSLSSGASGSSQSSTHTLSQATSLGPSLGVVGMLHSYDGERKEFGLFTPIGSVLNRLNEVTHVKWGIVGVPDDENEEFPAGGSDSSGSEDGGSSEGDD